MEVRLPKTFVEFRSSRPDSVVEAEILGPLWSGYRDILQKQVNSLGYTIEIAPRRSKIERDGNKWIVYLKAVVSGLPDDTDIEALFAKFEPIVDEAVTHISARLKQNSIRASAIKATFRRHSQPEVARNG